MSAAHTPGPWVADADDMQQGADDIFTVSIWAASPDDDRPHIGTVNAFSLLSEARSGTEYVTTDAPSIDKVEEAKANARLIAAAPDLLAACIAMLAERTGAAQLSDACQLAHEAIAKASDRSAR